MVSELYARKKSKPANYFYAEWVPTGMKQSEYNRLPVGHPVQIKHAHTGTFVEPIQFISRNENGGIGIKSLDDLGLTGQYFLPHEYRPMRLVILKQIRKEHFDMLPTSRSIAVPYGTWTDYYEIRAKIDNADDKMLVSKTQHVTIDSYLTDLEIFFKCGQPDWWSSGTRDARGVLMDTMLEEEIFKEYPSLKEAKHPKPEYLLSHEPFYGIRMSGTIELFDIRENYMGYMPLNTGLYMPSEFAGLIQKYKVDRIPSVRVKNIEFFIDGSHSSRRKNIDN